MAAADDRARVPSWYWAVAIFALLWEALGCFAYLSEVTGGQNPMPNWIMAVFAVAVWVGLAGAVGLLLRARWAVPALLVSLIAAAVQYGYAFTAAPVETLGPAVYGVGVAVLVIGGLLLWVARWTARHGWLR